MDRLHSWTIAAYFGIWLLVALLYQDFIFLAVLMLGMGTAHFISDRGRALKAMLPFVVPMIVLLLLINVIINRNGATIILMIPWPDEGFPIYWEPFLYSLAMGIKLTLLLAIFAYIQRYLTPERLISLGGNRFQKTTLVFALALRMFPVMIRDAHRTTAVMKSRGVKLTGANRRQTIERMAPLGRIALISSMESAWFWGEAMRARGYGSGSRTCYHPERLGRSDLLVLAACLFAALFSLWTYWHGIGNSSAYVYDHVVFSFREVIDALVLTATLLAPIWLLGGKQA